jgi:hypothetical protein
LVSRDHRAGGGNLVWEIGSGDFECHNDNGTFNAEQFRTNAASDQVKMIRSNSHKAPSPGTVEYSRFEGDAGNR